MLINPDVQMMFGEGPINNNQEIVVKENQLTMSNEIVVIDDNNNNNNDNNGDTLALLEKELKAILADEEAKKLADSIDLKGGDSAGSELNQIIADLMNLNESDCSMTNIQPFENYLFDEEDDNNNAFIKNMDPMFADLIY